LLEAIQMYLEFPEFLAELKEELKIVDASG
jgi:hypothetical protein